jgi:HEAT repeat protein
MLEFYQPDLCHGSHSHMHRRLELAKLPSDDDDLPDEAPAVGPSPGGGGRVDLADLAAGDFKKGRFSVVAIAVGVILVAVLVVFLVVGIKKDAERIGVEEAEDEKKAIFVLPMEEQLPRWRKWAASEVSQELKCEALKQLAWARDSEGVNLAIAALKDLAEPVKAMAASALAEYGSPMADPAKAPLMEALKEAGPGCRPQIAWALVELGEAAAFDQVMALYKLGHLSKVQRLGGGLAFDPDKIVRLISLDQLAGLAGDQEPAVRQLVATVLSRNAEPKWTDVLIRLLQDPIAEVARQAAPGLGKIGSDKAREPLLAALKGTDRDSRTKYLMALRDGIGTQGLVLAIGSVSENVKRGWYQTEQIFDIIMGPKDESTEGLNDPRGGDYLLRYIETKPHIHWQTRAATAMAKVGDERAVPTLAKRLRMSPLKIYSDDYDWEMLLKRDDKERVVASRMIADLAVLHPDKKPWIREQAEAAVAFWIKEMPSPHANGMRALAAMQSEAELEQMRQWSDPDAELPKEGQQPPMPEEWVIAQSALRYVGWMKDDKSWKVLEKSLKRRPKEIDVTMDSLLQGGLAIIGMTLRALGVGASHGFSEWGDPKAFKNLLEYAEDIKENEQARIEACAAIAWCATPEDMITVAEKLKEYDGPEKSQQFIRTCLLETLITRPVPGTAPALLKLMTPEASLEMRAQLGRAIGKAGITKEVEAKLFEMMTDDRLINHAALALILGGSPNTAARAVAMYADKEKAVLEELQDLWYRSFGYWSTEDLEKGHIFRWVDNAVAISRVEIRQTPQEWAKVLLMRQFDNLMFDNGPHSFTRVVLRYRLWEMAKGDDKDKRAGALRTLKFMKEQGVLLALREEKGEAGQLAAKTYHELMNPKLGEAEGVIETEDEEKK